MGLINGTDGADVLTGTSGNDSIYGFLGDDQIDGGAGSDYLLGGSGIDTIYGGLGDDTIIGGYDSNWMYGDDGSDYIDGAGTLDGGSGDDTLHGLGLFIGGAGNDNLQINPGWSNNVVDNYLAEGHGTDTVNLWAYNQSWFSFRRVDDDLVMNSVSGSASGGRTTFTNWYLGREYQVEQFKFSDAMINGAVFDTLPGETSTPPIFSISDARGIELGTMCFTVTRSGNTAIAASVDYETSDNSAVAGADYRSTSGTLNFSADQSAKVIWVDMIDDNVHEDNETFNLSLSNPSNHGQISRSTAIGTIIDDDVLTHTASADISVADANCSEGGVLNIVFSRSGNTANAISVDAHTSSGTATEEQDYNGGSGTINFAPGQTSVVVSLPTIDDSLLEGAETFSVSLSNPSTGARIIHDTATMTIQDNDTVTPVGETYRVDRSYEAIGPILWGAGAAPLNIDLTSSSNYNTSLDNGNVVGLAGGLQSDNLCGNSLNNQMWGGAGGNDTLSGGGGNDIYWFGRNNGVDIISASPDNAGDSIYFYDCQYSDITFSQTPLTNDLVVHLGESQLVLKDWYNVSNSANRIQKATFVDGFRL